MQSIEKDGGLIFNVAVVARASCSQITGEHDGNLKIRISAPPVEGAANKELIRVLAKAFGVAKNCVQIVSGAGSKTKRIRIDGAKAVTLRTLLDQQQTDAKGA